MKLGSSDMLQIQHVHSEELDGAPRMFTGVSTDSRNIPAGSVFFALRGERLDGHNFLSNAVDAMPGGGRLSVRARRAGSQIALSVSDTGPGIDAETRKRIFEPFFTTKAPGKGTGLGLAICREIAAALHGHVDVESQPGRGSTFTLVVPAPPLDDTGRAASSAAR